MEAKEKAKDLFNRFNNVLSSYIKDETACGLTAQVSALNCVNEIISANPHSNPFNTEVHSTMSYWEEVRKELEKL